MTIGSVLLGVIVSTLLGALLHLWRGGSLGRLIYYIFSSWIGFWIGHLVGVGLNWTFLNVGPLNLGMAILGDLVTLGIGYWLSLVRTEQKAR
jgi:hypothetical protein